MTKQSMKRIVRTTLDIYIFINL